LDRTLVGLLRTGLRAVYLIGQQVVISTELPPLDEEGQLVLIPEEILQVHERKLRNRVIREYLVKWKELLVEDATWEGE
jgi:hypothetical protein